MSEGEIIQDIKINEEGKFVLPISMVFDDLWKEGEKLLAIEYWRWTKGDFHSGTTFPGEIHLDAEQAQDFQRMMEEGLQIVFWVGNKKE